MEATDPYQVLGVDLLASDQEIDQVWKSRRNRLQPSSERGDRDAEKSLQEINAAHLEIRDRRRRERARKKEPPAGDETMPAAPPPPPPPPPPPAARRPAQDRRRVTSTPGVLVTNVSVAPEPPPWQDPVGKRWRDISADVTLPWLLALRGGTCIAAVDAGEHGYRAVELVVPAGCRGDQFWSAEDGGIRGGRLNLRFHGVTPHPHFRLDAIGNVHMSLRVPYADVYAGNLLTIPGPWEDLEVRIPPGHRDALRVAGHGRRTAGGKPGDLIVNLELVYPQPGDVDLEAALRRCQSSLRPEVVAQRV